MPLPGQSGLDDLGFNGVFQKPVNFDLLLNVLQNTEKVLRKFS